MLIFMLPGTEQKILLILKAEIIAWLTVTIRMGMLATYVFSLFRFINSVKLPK